MDDSQPGRGDLTDEQRQQRCEWAREMWEINADTPEWRACLRCVAALTDRGFQDNELIGAFRKPETNSAAVDALFEEYIGRKLIGEAP